MASYKRVVQQKSTLYQEQRPNSKLRERERGDQVFPLGLGGGKEKIEKGNGGRERKGVTPGDDSLSRCKTDRK